MGILILSSAWQCYAIGGMYKRLEQEDVLYMLSPDRTGTATAIDLEFCGGLESWHWTDEAC